MRPLEYILSTIHQVVEDTLSVVLSLRDIM